MYFWMIRSGPQRVSKRPPKSKKGGQTLITIFFRRSLTITREQSNRIGPQKKRQGQGTYSGHIEGVFSSRERNGEDLVGPSEDGFSEAKVFIAQDQSTGKRRPKRIQRTTLALAVSKALTARPSLCKKARHSKDDSKKDQGTHRSVPRAVLATLGLSGVGV